MRLATVLAGTALMMSGWVAVPALASKSDNTVRFATHQVPESIDPYFQNIRIGTIIAQHVWDTLVYRDPNTGEYKGLLATAWRQVDDKTLEFDLRQGVKFHNGEEFDADDVVYTLNYVSKPENKVVTQQIVSWIDRAEKVDKYKVRIIAKTVFPAAIEYLSNAVVIHPNEYYEKVGPKGQNEKPVGTGPYKVLQHAFGKGVSLERNADYFKDSPKGQPKIQKIEMRFIPDRQTQMAEIMSGGVDVIMYVPKDQADQMKALPNVEVVGGETMRVIFIQMNSKDDTPAPMLKDERVRKAIAHAIDRQAMVKQIVGEGSRVINAVCFPGQFGCSDDVTRYDYDPAKAKALLAEAGLPNGFEVDLHVASERQITEALTGYLQKVGIKANIRFMQYPAMRDQIRANKASLTQSNWGSFSINDASALTPVFYGFTPDDLNRDEAVRDLLKQGDTILDPQARKDTYKKALQIIADKAYAAPLFSLPVNYVVVKGLDNFKAYSDEIPRFWEMSWK